MPTHEMPTLDIVIAGLDPAIHHVELNHVFDGCAGQARA
jgi:hypothetical protein